MANGGMKNDWKKLEMIKSITYRFFQYLVLISDGRLEIGQLQRRRRRHDGAMPAPGGRMRPAGELRVHLLK